MQAEQSYTMCGKATSPASHASRRRIVRAAMREYTSDVWYARATVARWPCLGVAARMALGCGAFVLLVSGCSPPSPAPDVTVFQWMHAFAAADGTTMARLSCRASQADAQNSRLLTMALGFTPTFGGGGGGGGQFAGIGGGGGQTVYDVGELNYATTHVDSASATVRVTGLLRIRGNLTSQALSLNNLVGLVREQDQWRVCDSPAA